MEVHIHLRRRHLVAIAAVVAAAAGGVAYASIPDAAGVYTACKLNATGTIRLIDPSLGSSNLLGHCTALESQITWSQKGQAGANGVSPTVVQLPPGDAHCPAGGASITDAGGSTAFVCNGKSFAGTFQSPNGQYALSVADAGISLTGPSTAFSLAGGAVSLTADSETAQIGHNRSVTVGGNDALAVGADETVHVGRDRSTSIGRDDTVDVGNDRTRRSATTRRSRSGGIACRRSGATSR
jgi:hypothetical protein